MGQKQEGKVRAVLIGFGGMGRQYAQMIRDNEVSGMVLAGVCCRNKEGQKILHEEYPGVSLYTDVEDALAHKEEFDAAIIVTPHTSHVEIGRAMVRAGKHILVDKPAGVDSLSVGELIDEAKENQVSFAMIFNVRMNPAFQKAKELLQAGALGRVTRAVWICNTWYRTPAYHHSAPWRSSWNGECGGLLMNQNQHYLDIWQWLFGMPEEIFAVVDYGKYNDFAVDDSADLLFFYPGDFRGTMITASGENPGVNRLDIWGTKGRLSVEDAQRVFLDENEMSTEEFARTNQEVYGALNHREREIPLEENALAYQKYFQNFAAHLREGAPLYADGREGQKSLELANAAYLSSWTGSRQAFPVDGVLYREFLKKQQEKEARL